MSKDIEYEHAASTQLSLPSASITDHYKIPSDRIPEQYAGFKEPWTRFTRLLPLGSHTLCQFYDSYLSCLADEIQDTLAKGIVDLVMAHRTELYRLAGLAGEVDGHGGDRIRSKIEQMMRKFAMDNDLDAGVVRNKVTGKGAGAKKRKAEDETGGDKRPKKAVVAEKKP